MRNFYSENDLKAAQNMGYIDASRGWFLESNPYAPDSPLHEQWNIGYNNNKKDYDYSINHD